MWKNVRLLFGKEIIGAVRDRRTLVLTVFFPLVFYPLILAVMGHFAATEQTRIEAITPTVIIVDQAHDETFRAHLQETTGFYPFFDSDLIQAKADLKDGLGQVLMMVDKESGGPGVGLEVTLYYDQTNQVAVMAAGRVRAFLEGYLKEVMRSKLDTLGLDYDDLSPPLRVSIEDVASSDSVGRMILSRLLPYFMILAILTGAMGLGAEITAGEKERGTIATLLVSQLSRIEIVLGKFFTVLTVSLVSSLLSAVGLLIGVRFFGGGLTPAGSEATFSLSLPSFGWMLVVLVPLAVILSALVIIVGSFARSQKEASTYLMPIYMVIVLVGLISMTGGVSFEGARFLIPIANALYALQEIIVGDLHFMHLIYTLVANVFCGGLLILASIQVFKREAVL
ncbi:ABC transporter permease, partial [Candidatus Bipolaricaulota bacterium]|nr:ABC transporter permease [Candidatus Bipolaricaulota bacterium]